MNRTLGSQSWWMRLAVGCACLMAVAFVVGCEDKVTETETPPPLVIDADLDGIPDLDDKFPNDPKESADRDGDGVGDNGDVFPDDPAESADTDGDGHGNSSDLFPEDPSEFADADGDGQGDATHDLFPQDKNEFADNDKDGIGDNGDPDDDNDGVPDGADADADDDTFKSAQFGGDDCDDANAAINPGADDNPADDNVVDGNCDGLTDGNAAKGFIVDVVAGNDANDGSLAKPLKSIGKAVELAAQSLATAARPDIYLVTGSAKSTYEYNVSGLTIPTGINLYGGYGALDNGRRSRNLSRRTVVRATGGVTIGATKADAARDGRLDTIELVSLATTSQIEFVRLVGFRHYTFHRTVVTADNTTTALWVKGDYLEAGAVVELARSVFGNTGGANVPHVMAVIFDASSAGTLEVRVEKSEFIAGDAGQFSGGVAAYASQQLKSVVHFTMRDSKVVVGPAGATVGVLAGGTPGFDISDLHVGRVVLERNTIIVQPGKAGATQASSSGAAASDAVDGGVQKVDPAVVGAGDALEVAPPKPKSETAMKFSGHTGVRIVDAGERAVLRNNIVALGSLPTAAVVEAAPKEKPKPGQIGFIDVQSLLIGSKLLQHARVALSVSDTSARIINNTLLHGETAISIAAAGHEFEITNNLLIPDGTGTGLRCTTKVGLMKLRHNLFAKGLGTYVDCAAGNASLQVKAATAEPAKALNQLTAFAATGNLVESPAVGLELGKADLGRLQSSSKARDAGLTTFVISGEEVAAGFSEQDIGIDIDGVVRDDHWDIGAHELPPAPLPEAPPAPAQ